MPEICAVIPAAGRGSRLGLDCPKILVPIDGQTCVWDILRESLSAQVDRLHVVLAPSAMAQFLDKINQEKEHNRITISAQAVPLGMGDAIFGAESFWSSFGSILIVWGDQVNLSEKTIARVAAACSDEKTMVLPLVQCSSPYVQYDVEDSILSRVRQSREGDKMDDVGRSDVGVFALSTKNLALHWQEFSQLSQPGAQTGELNFLPFLPFLSTHCHWNLRIVTVEDPDEARGINTKDDLEFARQRWVRRS